MDPDKYIFAADVAFDHDRRLITIVPVTTKTKGASCRRKVTLSDE